MGTTTIDGWPELEFNPGKFNETEKHPISGKRGKLWEWMDIIYPRIGKTKRDRLAWLISLAQNSFSLNREKEKVLKVMMPGAWADRKVELAFFASLTTDGLSVEDGKIDMTEDQVKAILLRVNEMMKAAVNREEIRIDPFSCGGYLSWNASSGRYDWKEVTEGWTGRMIKTTIDLILEYGHLIRKCPAPPKHDKRGTECGTWFLANREDQQYCSARCQSRSTTRAARARGKAKELAQKRRKEFLAEVRRVKKEMHEKKSMPKRKERVGKKSKLKR